MKKIKKNNDADLVVLICILHFKSKIYNYNLWLTCQKFKSDVILSGLLNSGEFNGPEYSLTDVLL